MISAKRVTIVTGHYGSGKSEFSVNLALALAEGFRVALADVDVVNPYFRSRERRELLEQNGVRVVGNQLGIDTGVDLPAVSPEVYGLLRDKETRTIVDAGGDPVGARLLGSMRRNVDPFDTEVLCVVNTSRPETDDAGKTIAMIRGIEAAGGLTVTGLVNNTHMLEHTDWTHLLEGDRICREIRDETGIPIRYAGVSQRLTATIPDELTGYVLPIAMYLRESWMFSQ